MSEHTLATLILRGLVAVVLLILLITTAPLWLPLAAMLRPPKPKDETTIGPVVE